MIHRQNGLSQLTAELDRLPNLRVNVLEEAKGVPSAEVLSSKCNTWTVRRTLVVSQPWNSWRLSGGHRRRAELLAFPPEGSRASRRRSEWSCRRREAKSQRGRDGPAPVHHQRTIHRTRPWPVWGTTRIQRGLPRVRSLEPERWRWYRTRRPAQLHGWCPRRCLRKAG